VGANGHDNDNEDPSTQGQHAAHHHAYEQLLVGWFAGVYHAWERGRREMANTSTRPPSLRALARRVVRVLLATSPHLPRWARQVPQQTTPAPAPHDGRHTTHPQHHEQLLVGWILGGMAVTTTGSTNEGGGRRTTPHHPPPASRATACWVGCGWNDNDASNGE